MVNGNRMVAADVHASASWLVGLEVATGELWRRRVVGSPGRVLEVVCALGSGTRLLYEAGPCGFWLARAGAERGVAIEVCAPGSVPRAPGDRVKTDRRDAERLLRLWRAGELSMARIPTAVEEAFRDLVRAREDARGDLMRHRHRLGKFLLRRELRCQVAKPWTQKWMAWAAGLKFDDACARATFVDYLAAVQAAIARRDALDRALEQAWPTCPWAPVITRLRCFRGVDTLSACGLAAEIGDFVRFEHPKRLAGFLGIVPREHSSGERRHQGAITKAGPTHARRLLVEAAHHYRHPPAVGTKLSRRQHGQDPRAIAIAWRAQQRLHRRYRHLSIDRGKPDNVTTVALARELATFIWEAATVT